MNIGTKIIEIRKEKNMTQEDFAKVFHVTRQTVSNWENEKSYPDLQTLIHISDTFGISLDTMLKEDIRMVKKIDSTRNYKKAFLGFAACVVAAGICAGIYVGICKIQHDHMYDKVKNTGFIKEENPDFIARYQGFYALTEGDVDYLVQPKSIGKYELDTENFVVVARKGNTGITLIIYEDRKIRLALYPGDIEIDEKGNLLKPSKKLTDTQKKHLDNLLTDRKEEVLSILTRGLELWDSINDK